MPTAVKLAPAATAWCDRFTLLVTMTPPWEHCVKHCRTSPSCLSCYAEENMMLDRSRVCGGGGWMGRVCVCEVQKRMRMIAIWILTGREVCVMVGVFSQFFFLQNPFWPLDWTFNKHNSCEIVNAGLKQHVTTVKRTKKHSRSVQVGFENLSF